MDSTEVLNVMSILITCSRQVKASLKKQVLILVVRKIKMDLGRQIISAASWAFSKPQIGLLLGLCHQFCSSVHFAWCCQHQTKPWVRTLAEVWRRPPLVCGEKLTSQLVRVSWLLQNPVTVFCSRWLFAFTVNRFFDLYVFLFFFCLDFVQIVYIWYEL